MKQNKRSVWMLIAALVLLMTLVMVPTVSADGEPGETIPLVPPVDESTSESLFVPETCDPLEFIICVGPVDSPMPVVVSVASDGVNITLWLHMGESEPFGPVEENVTVPVTGTEVPVTLCPNTCPVPVLPDVGITGGLTVCLAVEQETSCVGPIPAVDVNSDGDSDGVPDAADPDPTDPYDPFFWRAPCDDDRSPEDDVFSMCKMEDGRYRIRLPLTGTTIQTGHANSILDGP